ncbi:MAG: transposase family protein [Deltaproteobacteria bacterium]|jgi:hypothetical protein|nr:transposase family protein [Deltaproteobacteria bacterium]
MKWNFASRLLNNNIMSVFSSIPDIRVGKNISYPLQVALLYALAMFFTKSQSFNNFANTMMDGAIPFNNLSKIFQMERCFKFIKKWGMKTKHVITPNTVRNMLDGIDTTYLDKLLQQMSDLIIKSTDKKVLKNFRSFNGKTVIALDGSGIFASKNINCIFCCTKKHNGNTDNPTIEYNEHVLAAVIVSHELKTVVTCGMEFIRNSAVFKKQDCEINAAKRLIPRLLEKIDPKEVILLGDDIYAHDPLIKMLEQYPGLSYIFTCKEKSHKHLYSYKNGMKLPTIIKENQLKGKHGGKEILTYSYMKNIDIKYDKGQVVKTNLVELEQKIVQGNKETISHFAFITNIVPTKQNVIDIVECGKDRWNIENGEFNVMKNQGYNLEHNFGHGKINLGTVMVYLLAIAFNMHVLANIFDQQWITAQAKFGTTKAFFEVFRSILIARRARSISQLLAIIIGYEKIRPSPG